jgi:hypothetical protein
LIYYLTSAARAFTMRDFLAGRGAALRRRIAMLTYDALARRRSLAPGTYIFSDVDRLAPAQAELAARAHGAISAAGWPVLNHPTRTCSRYRLLRRLYEHGINDFNVYRATEERRPERYPVFLRDAVEHTGAASGLLRDAAALDAALAARDAAGLSPETTLIVEFRDTADTGGVYRKYSAFGIRGQVLPRHVCFGRDWVLKAGTLFEPDYLAEERAYVETNPHAGALARVFALAGADFGRVDYAVAGGRLVVFEINTNPGNPVAPHNFGGAAREPVHAIFLPSYLAALEALDVEPRGRDLPVPWPRRRFPRRAWRALRRRLRDLT